MTRPHRHQSAYPVLWRAIDGAVRDAMNAHPEIQIPERRIASIVKRVTGQVLVLEARAARAAETDGGEASIPPSSGASLLSASGRPGTCWPGRRIGDGR